jgi:hypothetical protein
MNNSAYGITTIAKQIGIYHTHPSVEDEADADVAVALLTTMLVRTVRSRRQYVTRY